MADIALTPVLYWICGPQKAAQSSYAAKIVNVLKLKGYSSCERTLWESNWLSKIPLPDTFCSSIWYIFPIYLIRAGNCQQRLTLVKYLLVPYSGSVKGTLRQNLQEVFMQIGTALQNTKWLMKMRKRSSQVSGSVKQVGNTLTVSLISSIIHVKQSNSIQWIPPSQVALVVFTDFRLLFLCKRAHSHKVLWGFYNGDTLGIYSPAMQAIAQWLAGVVDCLAFDVRLRNSRSLVPSMLHMPSAWCDTCF